MRERYVNILAALRERYVGASTALRERYVGASTALRGRYLGASIVLRERGTIAYRRLPKYGVFPDINTRVHFLFKLSV